MPKAPAFASPYEEDEKTTIESGGWEEEASTTVEQGEVADKIRAIGSNRGNTTNITTSTGSGVGLDEPTVDDQRANAAIAMMAPPQVARLVITQGNDSGQEIEVRPGKLYTIGRGIDNDLVLTDIAVSRKHFDVRHENGTWVLADRGSGNGTLVNNNLEDAPFMLANGDLIEIGNTTFRFELPNGPPRVLPTYDVSLDEEVEVSTVSGKPMRELVELATPQLGPMTPIVPPSAPRPKTLPPPAPRPRTQSSNPPIGYAIDRAMPPSKSQLHPIPQMPPPSMQSALAPTISPMQQLQALHSAPSHQGPAPNPLASTMPMPQMANRPPLQPAILSDMPLANVMPTTIPGQGPPMAPAHPAQMYGYPNLADMGQHNPLMIAGAQPPRDATHTALVQPTPYSNGQPVMIPQGAYRTPAVSRRTKLILAGAALAALAALLTVVIVKSTGGKSTPKIVTPTTGSDTKVPSATDPKLATKPVTKTNDVKQPDTKSNAQVATTKVDTKAIDIKQPDTKTVDTKTTGTKTVDTKAIDIKQPDTKTVDTKTTGTKTVDTKVPDTKTVDTKTVDTKANDKTTDKRVATADRRTNTARTTARTTARITSDKSTDKTTEKHTDVVKITDDPVETPSHGTKSNGDAIAAAKNKADGLYRAKNFAGAAAAISAAASSASDADAKDLRSLAGVYSQLGKAYNVGMAPGAKAVDAYAALRKALNFDRSVGSAFTAEIQDKLSTVATKAAVSFMAAKDYESAFEAVRASENLGSKSPTNKSIREGLEAQAAQLYRSASSDLSTDPDGAKKKLRQITHMVDQKSTWYAKATKLLNG